jgi:beta-carotene hydroxylase
VYALGLYKGFFIELLVFWLLPSMLGVAITTLVFDHLPHAPHSDTGKYTNARSFPDKRIDWFVFMHSYHIVHHLWPSIPWYRYREAYIQRRAELAAAGNLEISLLAQAKI